MPPKLAALLKVTKSPSTAPCPVSLQVIVDDPLVAENVGSPALVVKRIGVTSINTLPETIYVFLVVPNPIYLIPAKDTHCFIFLHTPTKLEVNFFCHPPIFSGLPDLNLTNDPS